MNSHNKLTRWFGDLNFLSRAAYLCHLPFLLYSRNEFLFNFIEIIPIKFYLNGETVIKFDAGFNFAKCKQSMKNTHTLTNHSSRGRSWIEHFKTRHCQNILSQNFSFHPKCSQFHSWVPKNFSWNLYKIYCCSCQFK